MIRCIYTYANTQISWVFNLTNQLIYQVLPEYHATMSYLSLVDGNPVSGGKPLVALDIIDSIPEVAKALGQIHLKQISQQILQVWAEVRWEADLWTVIVTFMCVAKFTKKPIQLLLGSKLMHSDKRAKYDHIIGVST